MPSYVIVGASRGIGYQYLKTLSKNPDNVVVGIARSPDAVKSKVAADKLPSNVHVLQGDLVDSDSLVAAAAEVSKITGGAVDHLIINGAYLPYQTAHRTPADWKGKEKEFMEEMDASIHANTVGVVYTINAFIDLVKSSSIKKVIVISSGMGDLDFVRETDIAASVTYAVSKAGANMIIAKYAALYKQDGVIFLALSPGFVQTAVEDPYNVPPEVVAAQAPLVEVFQKYEPSVTGPITPEQSVDYQLKVIHGLTLKQTGEFLSHWGTKRWL